MAVKKKTKKAKARRPAARRRSLVAGPAAAAAQWTFTAPDPGRLDGAHLAPSPDCANPGAAIPAPGTGIVLNAGDVLTINVRWCGTTGTALITVDSTPLPPLTSNGGYRLTPPDPPPGRHRVVWSAATVNNTGKIIVWAEVNGVVRMKAVETFSAHNYMPFGFFVVRA